MPVTLMDRLPLPNLKVYTAGSVVLLSVAVYYALNVTSDGSWRANATLARAEGADAEAPTVDIPQLLAPSNATRNITEQFADVMTYMMQEPLCMWTVINMAYCSLGVVGVGIQRAVFGPLRVAEAQRVKDKFWNYVFYKFIFVFGVINVQYMDEVVLWCSWFTLVGFLHLLGQLCKDRFEYLSSSPTSGRWERARLALLLVAILAAGGALLALAAVYGLQHGRDIFAFMAAECGLVLVSGAQTGSRLVSAGEAGGAAYYWQLALDSGALLLEAAHVLHMVLYSNMLVSMASLVLLMQLRHLLHELQARLTRHRLYTQRATHITTHCPMASKEEVEKNQDKCAICWEPMKEARRLPCAHLFHNGCLCQWVQQDPSCPTCRRGLFVSPPPHNNRLFHFDGSRYVSWLPSFSVEVTRSGGGREAQEEGVARLQQLFPGVPARALREDLRRTRDPDLTAHNVLEGRLPLDSFPEETPREAPAAVAPPAPAAAAPDLRDNDPPAGFSASAAEREALLRRRKLQLLEAARLRYLARAGASAARSPPADT